MSNKLQTKLDAILEDKNTNLLPEHLKAGVTCLGVEGKFEGGVGQVKLFNTVEEMQNDTDAEEGDLAVVYRSDIQNMTATLHVQTFNLSATVTLPTAFTSSTYCTFIGESGSTQVQVELSSARCRIRVMGRTSITVTYNSTDGITYTRSGSREVLDCGEPIYCYYEEEWVDEIGYFLRCGGMAFEGLFEYQQFSDNNKLVMYGGMYYDSGSKHTDEYVLNDYEIKAKPLLKTISTLHSFVRALLLVYKDGKLYLYGTEDNTSNGLLLNTINTYCIGIVSKNSSTTAYKYELNLDEGTYTEQILTNSTPSYVGTSFNDFNFDDITGGYISGINAANIDALYSTVWYYYKNETKYQADFTTTIGISTAYLIAPTQLTATPDYVYEIEFYGKNGIENGILTQSISNSFDDTNAEVYSKIKDYYDSLDPKVLTDDDKTIDKNIHCIPSNKGGVPLLDTSSVTAMNEMFDGCTNLTFISQLDTSSVTSMVWTFRNCTNLTTIPLLDTSKVTNMDSMFSGCTSLTEIPQLDTSSVTIMANIFYNCINLTTIPLLDTSSVTDAHWMFNGCTNLTSIPELDTSKVDNMKYMFSGCANLTTIPLLNTSEVITMSWMFNGCTNLTDESLNNILLMCANATSYTNTKTLKDIGLTSEQATKCQSLSNYSAFTSAGWTTGY